jgi:hypothetical protein
LVNLNKNYKFKWANIPFSLFLKYNYFLWTEKEELIYTSIIEYSTLEIKFHEKKKKKNN